MRLSLHPPQESWFDSLRGASKAQAYDGAATVDSLGRIVAEQAFRNRLVFTLAAPGTVGVSELGRRLREELQKCRALKHERVVRLAERLALVESRRTDSATCGVDTQHFRQHTSLMLNSSSFEYDRDS